MWGGCVMLTWLMFAEAHLSKQIACVWWMGGEEDDSWDEMIEVEEDRLHSRYEIEI